MKCDELKITIQDSRMWYQLWYRGKNYHYLESSI